MDELCRDLARPIPEGPDLKPEAEIIDLTADGRRSSTDDPTVPVTQTVPAPVLPPLLQTPPTQDQTTDNALTNASSIVPVKAETVEVRVKTEDIPLAFAMVSAIDRENVNLPTSSLPNSLSSETTPKVEESSQPGPSSLSPQPWEYALVARDEDHAPIEDLLNCLAVEELQLLVKSLKVKCASKKVSKPRN